jgi:hypothetical protein
MPELTATSEESLCDLGPANFVIDIPILVRERIDTQGRSQTKNVESSQSQTELSIGSIRFW